MVSSASGYAFWLLAARLHNPAVVGLTAAVTSAANIMLLLSSLGVGGTLIESLSSTARKTRVVGHVLGGDGNRAHSLPGLCGLASRRFRSFPWSHALRCAGGAAVFAVGTVALYSGRPDRYNVYVRLNRKAGHAFACNFGPALSKVFLLELPAWPLNPGAYQSPRRHGKWRPCCSASCGVVRPSYRRCATAGIFGSCRTTVVFSLPRQRLPTYRDG